MINQEVNKAIDQIFRNTYGRLVSLLIARFGLDNIDLIENAVMDSYYKALKTWPYQGVPESARGWLYQVAKNALLDVLRTTARKDCNQIDNQHEIEPASEFNEELHDPELKLLFLICHPELKVEDRLAFMLKTLAGFGDQEVARALLTKKATVKKRILRARQMLKDQKLQFEWPGKHELAERRTLVHTCLYLLFNEGYYSSHQDKWIRKDLCLEAMRLCKYLCGHPLGDKDTLALMSLMCYHISRFESRIDAEGNIVPIHEQDRNKWDQYFIKLGHYYLENSASGNDHKSKFQIEAFISAQHCMATSFEQTDWKMLLVLYRSLYRIESSTLILLNLIMVLLRLDEIDEAKSLYEAIDQNRISDMISYYMVGVELYDKMKNRFQIELLLEKAIQSSSSKKEITYLKSKLENLRSEKNI